MSMLSEYSGSKDLFLNLTLRDLRSKYKRSVLGWAWSLINPLTYMVVFTAVFQFVFHAHLTAGKPSGLHTYALFLLTGLLPWNFMNASVNNCVGSLVGSANLIKKSFFPRSLLPIASVASALVSHLIEMGLLVAVLVGFGNWRALEWLPVTLLLMALVTLFAIGLGLFFSALNVYFRDIEHFLGIAFMVWFYATPIVYQLSLLVHHPLVIELLKINPMADAILCFRNTLWDGTAPSLPELGYFIASTAVVLVIGSTVFRRCEEGLAEEL